MDSEGQRSSQTRKRWLLIGAFVAFVVAFQLFERLVRTASTPSAEDPTRADSTGAARGPTRPVLRRLEDGAIEIRHDLFRRSTIRLENEDDADALFDCLEEGLEKAFGEGAQGVDRPVRPTTQRIQDECLAPLHVIPVPPRLPED